MCDRGPFHGWLFAYDASSLKRTGVFLTTPNGSHGGIWQAGGTPVVDPQGNLYVVTGDGEFDAYDGGPDYGDTFLKLRFAGNDPIAPTDYFTPFDQRELDVENVDLGASGPMVLPDQSGQHSHLLFGAGKNGSMYLINRDDMGHFQSSSNNQIVQYIPHVFPTKIHVSAAYWRNSTSEWIYVGPVEGTATGFSPFTRAIVTNSQLPNANGFRLSWSIAGHFFEWGLRRNRMGTRELLRCAPRLRRDESFHGALQCKTGSERSRCCRAWRSVLRADGGERKGIFWHARTPVRIRPAALIVTIERTSIVPDVCNQKRGRICKVKIVF